MKTISVELTDEQFKRLKTAVRKTKKRHGETIDEGMAAEIDAIVTDVVLRELRAYVYTSEKEEEKLAAAETQWTF